MALVLNDRVKETSTTTGTGTLNLDGAVQDFESFVAGIGTTNETYYCIVNPGTGEFEVGRGTVTDATPDTLSRTQVFSSSNSDNPVNFTSGTKDVFCTLPASKAVVEDASNNVTLPADLTVGANLDVSSGTIKLDGGFPTGTANTCYGEQAGQSITSTANLNTFVGYHAGDAVTTGDNNTALGVDALTTETTGSGNTCLGRGAASLMNGGFNSVFIGNTAGGDARTNNNVICIGRNAEPSSGSSTNEITLGDTNITSLRIPGLASGASSGDVLTYDGTDITLSTPTTGASEAFAIKMAVGL